MVELISNSLVKLIIGILVVVAVIAGFYLFFKNSVIGLFKDIAPNETGRFILSILK